MLHPGRPKRKEVDFAVFFLLFKSWSIGSGVVSPRLKAPFLAPTLIKNLNEN
jgi:hypothetical protein